MVRFICITFAIIWLGLLNTTIAASAEQTTNGVIRPVAFIPKTSTKKRKKKKKVQQPVTTILPSSPSPSKQQQQQQTSSAKLIQHPIGGSSSPPSNKPPSIYWAVLHNWLYFLSFGLNAINIKFLIRELVDGDSTLPPSARAIALSGNVESVDKFLTFAGIGFLAALSDKFGRKPLMIWSALGFGITNLIQASCPTGGSGGVGWLYFADFVDGCSSCMQPLCQAYITDVSAKGELAANLGIFQGLSAGGAFIIAFPIGGLIGAKYGPRIPLYLAAILQLLNATILLFLTPESNTPQHPSAKIDLREANPIRGLKRLFGNAPLLRTASMVFLLASLARSSLDAQFTNYSSIRFGWTQAQSGPVLVMVGFMLAIAPRLLVPWLGLKNSILSGLLILAAGLTGTGLSPTPTGFVAGIGVVSIGCVCLPALQALLANLAPEGERGAVLGAVGSVNELTGGIGSALYAGILARFTTKVVVGEVGSSAPWVMDVPGMHFLVGAGFLVVAWGIAVRGFRGEEEDGAFRLKVKYDLMDGTNDE